MNSDIEIKSVSKKFQNQQVLNKVNMICKGGKITGLIGSNGSGKTVLLKCICNFLQQDEGEILICGKKNVDYIKENRKVGAIIEEPAFLGYLSGMKNLELLYCISNQVNKAHLISVMKLVGLDPYSKKAVSKYSVGMKQRLAFAQAIMENQDILILDEPMNGLDIDGIKVIRNLILTLKNNHKTILLSSHNKDDINLLCDSIYKIESGKVNNCLKIKEEK